LPSLPKRTFRQRLACVEAHGLVKKDEDDIRRVARMVQGMHAASIGGSAKTLELNVANALERLVEVCIRS
jgi:hypothetical protein